MRYRRRAAEVEAIRVGSGDDWLRTFEWLTAIGAQASMHITTQNPEDDYIEVREGDGVTGVMARAYTGWWLVNHEGRVWALTPREFEAEYEPLDA